MSATGNTQNHRTEPVGESTKVTDSILKIALPIGLAVMAALLNASAVSQQMQTRTYVAFKSELPIGHVLREEDLVSVNLGGQTGQLNVPPITAEERQAWLGRILGEKVEKGELITGKHFGGVELGTMKEETLLLSSSQFGQSEAGLLRPGQWVYFTCYPRRDQTAREIHVGPFRVAAFDAQRQSDGEGGILLIYPADEKGRAQRRRLVEFLDDDKYRVTATLLGAKPSEQKLAINTNK
jgi:hypothetical protein